MAGPEIEVVHVGSASRDLTPDDPRGWRLGGGATYGALTTARLGLRTTALIGVDAAAATAAELDLLRAAGVEVHLAHLAEAPVFDNRETPEGRVQVAHAVGQPIAIRSVPASWLRAIAWSLVPVAGEIDDGWAAVVPAGAYLALGWQGMLRDLVRGEKVTHRAPFESALLRRADLVGVSRHDLDPRTEITGLPGAALVVTHGRDGGELIRTGGDGCDDPPVTVRFPSVASRSESDPTGAGDTFLAALLATVVRPAIATGGMHREPLDAHDLRFAAAAGSLVVEGPGLSAVPDLAAVLDRAARARDR
jgi:sugar/nucleoside kinase (ribokinase family)